MQLRLVFVKPSGGGFCGFEPLSQPNRIHIACLQLDPSGSLSLLCDLFVPA